MKIIVIFIIILIVILVMWLPEGESKYKCSICKDIGWEDMQMGVDITDIYTRKCKCQEGV